MGSWSEINLKKYIIKKESLNLWFCFTVHIQHQISITFNQVKLPRLSNIYPVDSNKRPPHSPFGNKLSSNRRAIILSDTLYFHAEKNTY